MRRRARCGVAGALLLAFAAPARAETTEEILFRARHAQLVEGDLDLAIRLYRQALEDATLPRDRQAEAHLRLAICCEDTQQWGLADLHLAASIYAGEEIPADVRRLADEVRLRVQANTPKPAPEIPARRDLKERIAEELRAAQGFLDGGDAWRALLHAKTVLDLDPGNAVAREIDAEAERRLSGAADFIRDPLRFVRKWTETRTTQVAATAQAALAKGAAHADAKRWNLAEAAFREAVKAIDACEFGSDSDRLHQLRGSIVARWDAVHRAAYGKPLDPAEVAPPVRPPTPLADYLNQLQRLLDLVSSGEHEYRLLPVQAPRAAAGGSWQRAPETMSLFRDLPSEWSPALFARNYLPLRVAPESWADRDNFLEAVGDMLVARHRPDVLDALLEEVKRIEQPDPATLPARFLLVPVPSGALERLEAAFGKFEVSRRGPAPVFFHVVAARYGVDYLCSFLRDLGADVRPASDLYAAELRNGVPQTLFAAAPLSRAPAYKDARAGAAYFGVTLDVYPLRDRTGRTATGMRILAKTPVPPLAPDIPRYMTQEAELFADLPPGATLVATGILDPFAAARTEEGAPREMVLLWSNPAPDAPETRPADALRAGAEVALGTLLLHQRDFPGPQADPALGFVAPEALTVLKGRALFLERFLREELGVPEATVDVLGAVLRVPPARIEDAAQVVAAMERESARSYVIEVQTRAVASPVVARWLAREELSLQPIEGAEYALADVPDPGQLLRRLDPAEPADAFAPAGAWPKPTALGLQARHVLSSRARTSPAYGSEEDLATGETRTITEGLRVTVRPYTSRGNTLRVEVDIETCALEAEEEERALALAIPSHRTRFSGSRVRGTLDLGNPEAPRTALLCRIPHPTESRPDRLVELVIALTVRRVP